MTAAHVVRLDHVQLAMPAGQERMARDFHVGLSGLTEVEKPAHLAARGGVWFESDGVGIHVGVEQDFRPARKAHPGLLVTDLKGLAESLRRAGNIVAPGEALEGYDHVYVDDPFGNRLELMERQGVVFSGKVTAGR